MNGRDIVVLGSAWRLFDAGTVIGMDDAQLLDRFLATRSEAAFASLMARHGPMVLGVCRGASRDEQDAQDAFQATFLVLARRAAGIRRRDSLASWLYGVARKIAVRARADANRRRWKERQVATRATAEARPGPTTADHAALHEEIARLPGTYREPIILCYLDGMTYEAAARHLDCPLGTLSIRLKRARERLRSRLTRRGVAIPAGLMATGFGPSPALAAIPDALAALAVRSALIAVGSEATVGGVVPATVASMAGRMTMMMRFKSFTVGMLVLGGVVVAATGSIVGRPSMTERGAPPQRPPAPEQPSWVRAFEDGTTVELLGVSPHPSSPGSWRKPGGIPLVDPPYHHTLYRIAPDQQWQVWEVAYRVRSDARGNQKLQVETMPESSSPSSCQGIDSMGSPIPGTYSHAMLVPIGQLSCELRFGLAGGTWHTQATGTGRDIQGRAREKQSVVFGKALEVGGTTFVTVSVSSSPDDLRVAAVDFKDTEHGPPRWQSVGVLNFQQMELEYDLPRAEIKEFRLQSRPYEWVVLKDVDLKPRTDVDPPVKLDGK